MHTVGRLMPRPSQLAVSSPEGEYQVILGHGLLNQIGGLAAGVNMGRRVVVVTDTNVAPLYLDMVLGPLREAGFEASQVVTPAGEAHKNWDSVSLIIDGFLDAGLDRHGWVMALGGGVVGDTAGFAAAVYMRGLPFAQAPTTLLAMADSSVGGKVGVDHARGKNLLGAFKQPRMVVADLDTLATLPTEQLACGMAEIIKAAVIGDPSLFEFLEETGAASFDYQSAISRAIEVKRRIVEADPYETGQRALLNLGHTFGHAFEKCTHYSRPHGFAVAQGMVVAFRLARNLGMCEPSTEERVRKVLQKWEPSLRWGEPGLTDPEAISRVWEAMLADKKRQDGRLRLALPQAIGKVTLVDSDSEDMVAAVTSALAELQ